MNAKSEIIAHHWCNYTAVIINFLEVNSSIMTDQLYKKCMKI